MYNIPHTLTENQIYGNTLPKDKILNWSKLNIPVFPYNKMKRAPMIIPVFDKVEDIMG